MIRNYTSTVAPEISCARIEKKLVQAGAENITKRYESGRLIGFIFDLPHGDQRFPIMLPIRAEQVFELLKSEVSRPRSDTFDRLREQAECTAWKLMYDWVDLQCSMIQLQQVQPLEVFMPFLYNSRSKKTLFEVSEQHQFKNLLPPPSESK